MNINTMLEQIRAEKRRTIGSHSAKEGLIRYSIIFTLAPGIFMLFTGAPLVGVSLLGSTLGLISSRENNNDKYTYKINRLNTEEAHLCKIAKGLDTSANAKAKRKQQLQILNKKQQEASSKYAVSSATSSLLNLGIATATIAGIAIPGPLSFISPVLSFAKIYKDKDKFDKKRICEKLETIKNCIERENIVADNTVKTQGRTVQRTVEQPRIRKENTNNTVKTATPKATYRQAYTTAYEPLYQTSESKGAYQKVRR